MSKKKDSSEEEKSAAAETTPEQKAEGEEQAEQAEQGGLWPVDRLKPVLEAVIFAAADPLPVRRMGQIIGATKQEVLAAIEKLQGDCEQRGIRLMEVAGGWQYRTAPEHHEIVKKLFKERPFRLSRAMIETLSILAYKQPATRAEIEAVRGVDCSGVLDGLLERKLAKIAGRRDVPGRPLVYTTTGDFLEIFGLKDLKSLPTLAELGDDLQAMADQSGFNDSEERNAPILPVEEGEDVSESTAAPADEQTPDASDDQEYEVEQAEDEEGARQ